MPSVYAGFVLLLSNPVRFWSAPPVCVTGVVRAPLARAVVPFMFQSRWWEGEGLTLHARTWVNEPTEAAAAARGSDWGRHPPRSADAFHQTYFEPLPIVFIVIFPFLVEEDANFPVTAFGFPAVFSEASMVTLIFAAASALTGIWATPPIKLAAEPSRIIVFAKLD